MEYKGYGPHLMIDLNACNTEKLADLELCRYFLSSMPDAIGMTKITEPNVFWYNAEEKEEQGITGMVIIAESHISIHTYPYKQFAFIDVFSCKPFDTELALQRAVSMFESADPQHFVSLRGEKFPKTVPVLA